MIYIHLYPYQGLFAFVPCSICHLYEAITHFMREQVSAWLLFKFHETNQRHYRDTLMHDNRDQFFLISPIPILMRLIYMNYNLRM